MPVNWNVNYLYKCSGLLTDYFILSVLGLREPLEQPPPPPPRPDIHVNISLGNDMQYCIKSIHLLLNYY